MLTHNVNFANLKTQLMISEKPQRLTIPKIFINNLKMTPKGMKLVEVHKNYIIYELIFMFNTKMSDYSLLRLLNNSSLSMPFPRSIRDMIPTLEKHPKKNKKVLNLELYEEQNSMRIKFTGKRKFNASVKPLERIGMEERSSIRLKQRTTKMIIFLEEALMMSNDELLHESERINKRVKSLKEYNHIFHDLQLI